MPERPRVFISYSHDSEEHRAQVRALADRLCADGVDCTIDQYVPHPAEGWPSWMDHQIEEADFVLVVCTETYFRRVTRREEPGAGRGATFESVLIQQALYEAGMSNQKFLPVLFDADAQVIPRALRSYTSYRIDAADEGYEALLRRLTRQPAVIKPPVAPVRDLPPDPVVVERAEAPTRPRETRAAAIARWLRRRWRWSAALTLLACSGLAGIWWTLHEPSRLYRRGLQAKKTLELPAARNYLERALRSGNDLPLERSTLAEVLLQLGVNDAAKEQAKLAFDAREKLAYDDRLLVEARFERIAGRGPEAVRKYEQLRKMDSGDVEYALGLADAQMDQGQFREALSTIEAMQKTSQDPRLDISEAQAVANVGDAPKRQLAAASRAVAKAARQGLELLAAEGLLLRGAARRALDQPELAIEDFQDAERRAREGNPEQAARAQNGIATVQYDQGDLQAAEKSYRQALRSYEDLRDLTGAARQEGGLAAVHAQMGKLGQAREEYEKDLHNANRSQRAVALAGLGLVLQQQGDLAGASERLQEAIGIFEDTGEQKERTFHRCKLAQVYADALELGRAKSSLSTCLEEARALGGPYVADAETAEGIVLLVQGDLEHAWEAHKTARKTYEELGLDGETKQSLLHLAEIQSERDLPLEARSLIEPALEYFSEQRMADDKGFAQAALARTYLAQGVTRRAQSLIDAAKERVADSEALELRVQVALVEAGVLAAVKKVPEAREVIQRQLADPATGRCPRLRLQARLAQGEIEVVYGDSGRGRELLSRVEEDAGVRGYRLVAAKAARLLANP